MARPVDTDPRLVRGEYAIVTSPLSRTLDKVRFDFTGLKALREFHTFGILVMRLRLNPTANLGAL